LKVFFEMPTDVAYAVLVRLDSLNPSMIFNLSDKLYLDKDTKIPP